MSCSRIICSLFFTNTILLLLSSSTSHAITVNEGEQVAMVIHKIEAATNRIPEQQLHELQVDEHGDTTRSLQSSPVSVADGCFNNWDDLFATNATFGNNTALYLCDGFSSFYPVSQVISGADKDITISCLGRCNTAYGGGPGGLQVLNGARVDLFGIDFDFVSGVRNSYKKMPCLSIAFISSPHQTHTLWYIFIHLIVSVCFALFSFSCGGCKIISNFLFSTLSTNNTASGHRRWRGFIPWSRLLLV
jgi:hypothetical protein